MASPTLCFDDFDCWNGGSCDSPFDFLSSDHVDATSTARCICPPGFGGLRCEKTCPIRCENKGQCDIIDDHAGFDVEYRCICPSGFSGLRCENSQDTATPSGNVSVAPQSTHSQKLGTGPIVGITVGILLAMLLAISSITIYIVKVSKRKKLPQQKPSKEESPETVNEDEGERVEEILGLEEGEFVQPEAPLS
ncbi:EGF-like domain containing protein [Nitzschia inconspicua]|uniref:EGF-like domain containing protein n=1 Tax=Nitzschia inconspicua TaxID=303405 RepID=A0A9K3KSP5_9STRA|nr:EGF-like domain containing protein [Nitzschia inconspicua]